jgi:hypothetical protein
MNSMVTDKNSSVALLTDASRTDADDGSFNFSLHQATTIKVNKFEYDDAIDIDSSDE